MSRIAILRRLKPSAGPQRASVDADFHPASIRSEVVIIVLIAVVIFIAAIILPTEDWMQFALTHQDYYIDEFISLFVALSFVFMVFAIRRRREAVRLAGAREKALDQIAQASQLNSELSQMANFLQTCSTIEEANEVLLHFLRQLLPDTGGAVYLFRSSRNALEITLQWGQTAHEPSIDPQHCWALRRGQLYDVRDVARAIRCRHVESPVSYVCVPMIAHGEVLALLHVRLNSTAESNATITDTQRSLACMFSEHVAVALSNLRLRENLKQQSIRDSLTGLFNRRYLEEAINIEIERAKRHDTPVYFIMLDLDHFKRLNDTHGHEAGDAVLQAVGRYFLRTLRGGDIACRYGGEEFAFLMAEISPSAALQRAEQLLEGIRTLPVEFAGAPVGPLTASIGLAAYPIDGDSGMAALHAADAALYRAKAQGRDCVVAARDSDLAVRDHSPATRRVPAETVVPSP